MIKRINNKYNNALFIKKQLWFIVIKTNKRHYDI